MTDNPPAGIHPLRERLADAMRAANTPDAWIAHAPQLVTFDHFAGVAIGVFAAWLREEAAEWRRRADQMRALPNSRLAYENRAYGLDDFAAAIYPKEAHDGLVR